MRPISVDPIGQGHDRRGATAILIVAVLLFGYVLFRCISVSFTIDETFTFVNHVRKGVLYPRTFDRMSANHHLLNVWGMWCGMKLFGTGELALRLPNVMAHALYLYASARIALKAGNAWLAVAGFLLLNLHPYLLDFFGTARGYGMACGLMMMSLWQVVRYLREGQPLRSMLLATLFAALAALAHLVLLNYLLGLAVAFVLTWALQARRTGMRRWLPHLLVLAGGLLTTGLVLAPIIHGMRGSGSLYYGCEAFWSCTMRSFGEKVLYHLPYRAEPLTLLVVALVAIAAWWTISVAAAVRWKWTQRLGPFAFGLVVLIVWSGSVVAQHRFLGMPLPQTRTALFAIPLLSFLVVTCTMVWPVVTRGAVPKAANLLLAVPLVFHQVKSLNTTYTVEWKPSGEIAHMMDLIARDHRDLSSDLPVITVSASYESYGCAPYYRLVRDMPWLMVSPRQAKEPYRPADHYIVEYDGHDAVDTTHWSLMYRSEATNTGLYRDERYRRSAPVLVHRERLDMEAPGLPGATVEQHASGMWSVRFDSAVRELRPVRWVVPPDLAGTALTFTANASVLQTDEDNFIALVISVVRDGQELGYVYAPSVEQLGPLGAWGPVGAVLRPWFPLLPGDLVQLRAWPLSPASALYVDDLELRILR